MIINKFFAEMQKQIIKKWCSQSAILYVKVQHDRGWKIRPNLLFVCLPLMEPDATRLHLTSGLNLCFQPNQPMNPPGAICADVGYKLDR